MLLDACTSFCASMSATFGPTITEIIMVGAGLVLGWWKIRKVAAESKAGVAAANEEAKKAKEDAQAAHVQLAELRGSLRPASYTAPLGTSSSSSGNFERVVMPELGPDAPKPRPSMPDPTYSAESAPSFPRPSAVPSFDRETPRETPRSKGDPNG